MSLRDLAKRFRRTWLNVEQLEDRVLLNAQLLHTPLLSGNVFTQWMNAQTTLFGSAVSESTRIPLTDLSRTHLLGSQVGALQTLQAIQNQFKVRVGVPASREGLSATLGVRFHGAPDLREGVVQLALPQQEVPISPGNFSRQWIRALRLEERLSRVCQISFRFVCSAETEPGIR
jgi:hypothetical protein